MSCEFSLVQHDEYNIGDRLTDEGQVFSGLLVAETDHTVTLRRSEGIEEIVERKRVDELRSTGRSLMPDGFEQLLTPQDAADLIEYLRQAASARE
jgi:putative heme-binding domain-containing protein